MDTEKELLARKAYAAGANDALHGLCPIPHVWPGYEGSYAQGYETGEEFLTDAMAEIQFSD